MESMGEVDEENEEGEQPDPLPVGDSAPSATAIPEDYQWNSWDEYYAYFYGCYGRYPSEEELQSFMNQSDRAVAQSNSHLVFDESGAQESAENVTARSISTSKRKNRKKRKREPPTTAPVEENTDLAGEDENDYYQEEEYYEEEEYHPPVSKTNLKYWYQRYSLFSKWDEGIELDEEGWFSVTPESIARHIAAKCRKALMPPGSSRGRAPGIVVDAMCGPGGNSIQFASRFGLTLACDIDPQKIRLAKNNATVYGVQNDIDFIIGDCTYFSLKYNVRNSAPWSRSS
jgi:16S rRNA C967 or C1407 C5-methylase (RsmB/RsmF family)